MSQLYCFLSSPVHLNENKTMIIPPVNYEDRLYIIQDKKLFEVLSRIGMLTEFIQAVREKGYEYTSKWFSFKKLMNQDFLETISKYWIEDVKIKKIQKYKAFCKNEDHNSCISGEHLSNYFKNAILYNYIAEKNVEFNIHAETLMDLIEKELRTIKNKDFFEVRKCYHSKNFFKNLMDRFLIEQDLSLTEKLESVDALNISFDDIFNNQNLVLYKTAGVKSYKNNKFQFKNVAQRECVKENTIIKFNIKNKCFSNYWDLDFLFEQSANFAKGKLEFEKKYVYNMILQEKQLCQNPLSFVNENRLSDSLISNKLKEINKNINSLVDDSFNLSVVNTIQTLNNSINDYIKRADTNNNCINRNYPYTNFDVDDFYSCVENTNILLDSDLDLTNLAGFLNLEQVNAERVNQLMFSKDNEMESKFVKLSFKNSNKPHKPTGYARINYI